jgi:hypothetical protein
MIDLPDPVFPDQIARLKITPEFLTGLLSIAHQGKGTGRFKVLKDGLPGDVQVCNVTHEDGVLVLTLRSCAFARVELGETIPLLESPTFQHVTE